MNHKLTPEDFPLRAIGALVYAKTQSSPILTAPSDAIAADICDRLNYSDICGFGEGDDFACDPVAARWSWVTKRNILENHKAPVSDADKGIIVDFGTGRQS
jgi:hypothetical protein